MQKKDFMWPSLKDLREGNVLPIYKNFKEEEELEGEAILIKYSPGWREELPYIRAEIGGTNKQDPHTVNWSYQRWTVKFISGEKKGFRTARYIAYFHSIDSYLSS